MHAFVAAWILEVWHALSKVDLTVVLTVVVAVPAYWSALISRNVAEQQLRAYVSIGAGPEDVNLKKDPIAGKWAIYFSYRNNGITPAYNATIATNHVIADCEDVKLPPNSAPYVLGTIGPCDSIKDDEPTDLSDDDVEQLKRGQKVIIIYGQIRYIDAFKKVRWTKFRFYTGGSAPYMMGPASTAHTIYPTGVDSN